jgi:hypothetical protein
MEDGGREMKIKSIRKDQVKAESEDLIVSIVRIQNKVVSYRIESSALKYNKELVKSFSDCESLQPIYSNV